MEDIGAKTRAGFYVEGIKNEWRSRFKKVLYALVVLDQKEQKPFYNYLNISLCAFLPL